MYDITKSITFVEGNIDRGSIICYLSTSRDLVSNLESPKEVGSVILVLELLKSFLSDKKNNEMISYLNNQIDTDGTFHFFEDKLLLPNDTDTTSRSLSTLLDVGSINHEEASVQAKRIIENIDESGIIQTYYNSYHRIRDVDPTALMNIISFLYKTDFDDDQFSPTLNFLETYIQSNSYQKPTRYYFSPMSFLYSTMKVAKYNHLFKNYLEEIIEKKKYSINGSIDLSMLVQIKNFIGFDTKIDNENLMKSQQIDGSFPYDSIYKYANKNYYFGSHVISTAFAIRALSKT